MMKYTAANKMPANPKNNAAKSAARRKLSVLNTLGPRKQFVSRAAQSLNDFGFAHFIELRAQATNVTFDNARMRIEVHVPHFLEQHFLGDDTIGVAHEVFEKPKFLRMQMA